MKLRCLVLDDEPLAHKVILEYAKEAPYLEIVAQAYLPTVALEILKEQPIDLMFLDIQMPKLNGLEMLRLVEEKPEVIITSAYEEYALESYELKVCDYLLKPFRLGRFLQATEQARDNYRIKNSIQDKNDEVIFIKSEKRLIQIKKSDIYYIESYGNYVKVWTETEFLLTAKTLSSFVQELISAQFFRIHKSYLINKAKIGFVEGNKVVMKNKVRLPISKNYKAEFMDFLK